MCNPVAAHVMSLPVCTLIMASCLYFNTIVISLPFTGSDRCIRLMVMFEGMLELKMEITQLELSVFSVFRTHTHTHTHNTKVSPKVN